MPTENQLRVVAMQNRLCDAAAELMDLAKEPTIRRNDAYRLRVGRTLRNIRLVNGELTEFDPRRAA